MNRQPFVKLENDETEKNGDNIRYFHHSLISPIVIEEYLKAVDPVVALVMVFNFTSSVSIVSVNKYVTQLGFRFMCTLTCIHFIVTFLDIFAASRLALGNMGFVVLTNLSLRYNSVGCYQVLKHLTTPVIVFIEAVFYKIYLERKFYVPLTLVCVGVTVATLTDLELNFLGIFFGLTGVVVTSLYQVWCGTLQKSLEANPLQLQYYIAPLAALFLAPLLPILEDYKPSSPFSIFQFDFTVKSVSMILLSSLIAFCVNISIFMVIGKTSAITYNVLGHSKTCSIFLIGFLFFKQQFSWLNFSGIILTLWGVFWYTKLKLESSNPPSGKS
ncbi:Solute carrier family 35 member E3 [Galdieria sulphuraria]|nr:Solute carrier family 35 member E3 [Galdieria sulphuraria]